MNQLITLGKSGRLVIPTQFRKALGLKVGEGVMIALKEDHIEITPVTAPVKHVQERVSKYLKPDDDLVDILFKQRKEEVLDER